MTVGLSLCYLSLQLLVTTESSVYLSQYSITLGCERTKRRYDMSESYPVEARVGGDVVREKEL